MLLWIIWYPALKYGIVISRGRLTYGPICTDNSLEILGVFEPGGCILFNFSTDNKIASLEGKRKKFVKVTPLVNESQLQQSIIWEPLRLEEGEKWRGPLQEYYKASKVNFNIWWDIPDTPLLLGQKIPLSIEIDIIYPIRSGGQLQYRNGKIAAVPTYEDTSRNIRERVEITLDGQGKPLSFVDTLRQMILCYSIKEIALQWLWVVGIGLIIRLCFD